jgi:hypothetical protein
MEYVQTNTAILNVLWSLTCGRKMHAQQQEFQVEKNRFLSYLIAFSLCEEKRYRGVEVFGSVS